MISTVLASERGIIPYVSTEDEEIAEIARNLGAEVIARSCELAQDETPIDPVVIDAVAKVEQEKSIHFDAVATIQPTSPLLSVETFTEALDLLEKGGYDSVISVSDATHLYWTTVDSKNIPMYSERKNRQYLNPIFKETGAFIACRRGILEKGTRIAENVGLLKVPAQESIDIDSYTDWYLAESMLRSRKVLIRVDESKAIGLGHVYRGICLANHLSVMHKVRFVIDKDCKNGIEKLRESGYPPLTVSDESGVIQVIEEFRPDIIINDVLNTSEGYIRALLATGVFIVNFEDFGPGASLAHILINALYEHSSPPENQFFGYRYEMLRDEFLICPKKNVIDEVKKVLITFGGTDPNDLTRRSLEAITEVGRKDISYDVVIGPGYEGKVALEEMATVMGEMGFLLQVQQDVRNMARMIYGSDLVITSNGRTIYEIASIGTPAISISQNERESRHLFTHISGGVEYLGISYEVGADRIALALKDLINTPARRKEMSANLLRFDLRNGGERIESSIMDAYWSWKNGE